MEIRIKDLVMKICVEHHDTERKDMHKILIRIENRVLAIVTSRELFKDSVYLLCLPWQTEVLHQKPNSVI